MADVSREQVNDVIFIIRQEIDSAVGSLTPAEYDEVLLGLREEIRARTECREEEQKNAGDAE